MKNPELRAQNRRALIFLLLGVLLAAVLASLPLFHFSAVVYSKKSPNTFVGDETYRAVKAEVEAIAADYSAQGLEVKLIEEVIERVNSKGETTSLVSFSLSESFGKNLWSFLGKGIAPSFAALGIVLGLGLSGVFAILGLCGSIERPVRELDARSRCLRSAASVSALIALLLVPVLLMMNNYAFSRQLSLYGTGLLEQGREQVYARMDRFLFAGTLGENAGKTLSGLQYSASGMSWLLLAAALIVLLAAVQIRYGLIKGPVLRALLYAFVVIVCLVTLYPYYVMLITAFRSNAETLDMYFLHLFPTEWIWSNLTDIVHRGVPRYLLNSVFVAGGATALAIDRKSVV